MKISNEMIMIILYLVQFFKKSFEFIKFYSKFKIGKRLRLITLYVKSRISIFMCTDSPPNWWQLRSVKKLQTMKL